MESELGMTSHQMSCHTMIQYALMQTHDKWQCTVCGVRVRYDFIPDVMSHDDTVCTDADTHACSTSNWCHEMHIVCSVKKYHLNVF